MGPSQLRSGGHLTQRVAMQPSTLAPIYFKVLRPERSNITTFTLSHTITLHQCFASGVSCCNGITEGATLGEKPYKKGPRNMLRGHRKSKRVILSC